MASAEWVAHDLPLGALVLDSVQISAFAAVDSGTTLRASVSPPTSWEEQVAVGMRVGDGLRSLVMELPPSLYAHQAENDWSSRVGLSNAGVGFF